MNKAIIVLFLLIASTTFVLASNEDEECKQFGYAGASAKWNWLYPEEFWYSPSQVGFTSVVGNDTVAHYDGMGHASAVVIKAGRLLYPIHNAVGTVYQEQPSISHITFCYEDVNQIPEFSTIGAVMVLAFVGIFLVKRNG